MPARLPPPDPPAEQEARQRLFEKLAQRTPLPDRIRDALLRVPRHAFCLDEDRPRAYQDEVLPLDAGATLSQPFVVASTLAALDPQPGERLLEVGSGSGYVCALLAELGCRVVGLERIPALAERASRTLASLGYTDALSLATDGRAGWPADAPYDAVLLSAATPAVPRPLFEQLRPEGRLLAPVGRADHQELLLYRADRAGDWAPERLYAVRFVPLV